MHKQRGREREVVTEILLGLEFILEEEIMNSKCIANRFA